MLAQKFLVSSSSEIARLILCCVKSFLQSIIDDTPLLVNGRDAYASLAACVAADNSVKQGETTIPESEYFN